VTAAVGGLLAPLIATDGLFGFDFNSYVWRGYGLYTQLWAMVLLPVAVAQGYVTLRDGKGYFWTMSKPSAAARSRPAIEVFSVP
jgi:hypothetical protein